MAILHGMLDHASPSELDGALSRLMRNLVILAVTLVSFVLLVSYPRKAEHAVEAVEAEFRVLPTPRPSAPIITDWKSSDGMIVVCILHSCVSAAF